MGKRQEIKKWLKEAGMHIALLQETKVKDQTLEEDDDYKIYYASDPKDHTRSKGKGKKAYSTEHAGTAIVISTALDQKNNKCRPDII